MVATDPHQVISELHSEGCGQAYQQGIRVCVLVPFGFLSRGLWSLYSTTNEGSRI